MGLLAKDRWLHSTWIEMRTVNQLGIDGRLKQCSLVQVSPAAQSLTCTVHSATNFVTWQPGHAMAAEWRAQLQVSPRQPSLRAGRHLLSIICVASCQQHAGIARLSCHGHAALPGQDAFAVLALLLLSSSSCSLLSLQPA